MDPELYNSARLGNEIGLKRFAEANPMALEGSTPNGNTALHIASQVGNTGFAVAMCRLCPSLLLRQNSRGDTALHAAAKGGHSVLVSKLVDYAESEGVKGEILRTVNMEGNTALHEAAKKNGHDVVKLLIEEDRDLVLVTNGAGASALYVAAQEGHDLSVEPILEVMKEMPNACWGGPEERTPLHAAVIWQHGGTTRLLCEARPEFLREKDAYGNYPIHYAVADGDLKIERILLHCDKSIAYFRDKDNRCPFHLAAYYGHISIIEELLQQFPDIGEARDGQNWNALHIAVERENLEVIRYILKSDKLQVLINERNNEGNTPLHLAIACHHFSVSLLLITDRRVDLNVINGNGQTALDMTESNQMKKKLEKILVWKVLIQMGGRRGLRVRDTRERDPTTENGMSNGISTIAGLIITTTFAAAFAVPGMYISGSNEGKAGLTGKPLLWVFIITDAMALFSAMCIALLLLFAGRRDDVLQLAAISRSIALMAIALLSLTLSFLTGISLVLSKEHAIITLIVSIGFFISLLHWLFSWVPLLYPYFKFRCQIMLISILGLPFHKR